MFKDEPSFWSHSNNNHKIIVEFTSQFTDVYDQLPKLDFDLLGDATGRRGDLVGCYEDQKLRLCKLFALRRVIKHSHKTRSKLEQERLRRRAIEKREGGRERAWKRKQALRILNDENCEMEYQWVKE